MIKERLVQVLESKGIPKEAFFKKIEMSSANFRGNAKKTPLNSTAIKNILSEIPDLNVLWLITGDGKPFDNKIESTISTNGNNNQNINNINGRVTISSNDLSSLIERENEKDERLKECQNLLSESQKQITILLDILKNTDKK